MVKNRIVFVGSFPRRPETSTLGGLRFACETLVTSPISAKIDWFLIDSTQPSVHSNMFVNRFIRVLKRFCIFTYYLLFKRIDSVLIYCGEGLSFYEKGLMIILAKLLNTKTYLAPRSGLMIEWFKKKTFQSYFIWVMKRVDVLICQSEYWKQYYMHMSPMFDETKFVIIFNCVNIRQYPKKTYIDKETELSFLFLGWLTLEKGIFELLNAFQNLVRQSFDIKLIIAGDGPEADNIKRWIMENNLDKYIEMLGWVRGEQKHRLLLESDVFVQVSYFEGMPNALLEAMATGLACVASSVGAIPEMLEHGKNGLLCSAKDIQSLEQSLYYLIQHPDQLSKMGLSAREKVIQEYNIEHYVAQYDKILNS